MSKSRTVRAALGLPLAATLTFSTTSCLPEDGATQGKSSKGPAASNGIDELKGDAAFDRALKATESADSVRLRGQEQDGEETYDLDFRYAGRNRSKGTIRQGAERLEIIRIGSAAYFKGNRAFYESEKVDPAGVAGKYIRVSPKSRDYADMMIFTDLGGYLRKLSVRDSGLTMGEVENVGGTPAVSVKSLAGVRTHIAAQGTPYLLRLVIDQQLRLDFLSYNERVDLKPPPAGLVIDAGG
jgi:hypothetical protein